MTHQFGKPYWDPVGVTTPPRCGTPDAFDLRELRELGGVVTHQVGEPYFNPVGVTTHQLGVTYR